MKQRGPLEHRLDDGIAGEIGRTVRRSLGGWGMTLRLCVVATVATVLWAGAQAVEHAVSKDGPVVCFTTTYKIRE